MLVSAVPGILATNLGVTNALLGSMQWIDAWVLLMTSDS